MTQAKTDKKSSLAGAGVFSGGVAVCLALFIAISSNSLALWADWIATLLDFLAIFIAWQGFKKIETNSTEVFNYGFGRFESFASMGMSVLMVFSFLCIMTVVVMRFITPVMVEGFGVLLGIILHLIFGAINGALLYKTAYLEKQEKSTLMTAQRRVYTIKFSANLIMFLSLVFAFFGGHYRWVVYVDPVAAMVIAIMILASATKIFRHSARDLLDYALEEHSQLLILRALVNHFDRYENIQNIRTRAAGGKVYVEIFLEFDGALKHSEVMETAKSLQSEIIELLKCDEALIIPVPPE